MHIILFFTFLSFLIFPISGVAVSLESTASIDSSAPLFTKSYARFSMISSRSAQKTDFRSLKTLAVDDSGGMSESTILPNQNFITGFGLIELDRKHQLLMAVIQGVDKEETRMVATPFGSSFLLPGRIAVAGYRFLLSEKFSLSASAVHVDTFGVMDPSLGIGYRNMGERGGNLANLLLTAPLTEKSRKDKLLTRATLRLGMVRRWDNWMLFGRLSHSRPFYQDPANLDKPAGAGPGIRPVSMMMPSEVDLILIQREKSRSTASLGTQLQASRKLRMGMSGQLVNVSTFKNKEMWITHFKALSAAYTLGSWEAGASFGLSSDILKFKSPSFPNRWSAGVNLSYAFGQMPGMI